MKIKSFILLLLSGLVFLFGCGSLGSADVEKVSVERAKEIIDSIPDLVIIDVRTLEEYRGGYIHRSENIDINKDDFEQKVDLISKEKEIMVVCAAGTRSAKAVDILQDKGFKKIYEIEGGMDEWKAKRMKVSISF